MSVRKNFSLTERFKLQIGLNAYNFLKHGDFLPDRARSAIGKENIRGVVDGG